MFPEKNAAEKNVSEVRLRIAASRDAKEFWPVGWPPKGNPSETLPELFRFLKVEIADQLVTDRVINELMGKDASARFRFIMDRAEDAVELDV